MTEDAYRQHDAERARKIARLQQLVNEGLASGISDLTVGDIRRLARDRAKAGTSNQKS